MRIFPACAAAVAAALGRSAGSTGGAWQAPGTWVTVVKDTKTNAPLPVDSHLAIGCAARAFISAALAIPAGAQIDWDKPVRQNLRQFRLSAPPANGLVPPSPRRHPVRLVRFAPAPRRIHPPRRRGNR